MEVRIVVSAVDVAPSIRGCFLRGCGFLLHLQTTTPILLIILHSKIDRIDLEIREYVQEHSVGFCSGHAKGDAAVLISDADGVHGIDPGLVIGSLLLLSVEQRCVGRCFFGFGIGAERVDQRRELFRRGRLRSFWLNRVLC